MMRTELTEQTLLTASPASTNDRRYDALTVARAVAALSTSLTFSAVPASILRKTLEAPDWNIAPGIGLMMLAALATHKIAHLHYNLGVMLAGAGWLTGALVGEGNNATLKTLSMPVVFMLISSIPVLALLALSLKIQHNTRRNLMFQENDAPMIVGVEVDQASAPALN
jgi:hypothetical protein